MKHIVTAIIILIPLSLSAGFFTEAVDKFKNTSEKAGEKVKKDVTRIFSDLEHARRASDMMGYAQTGGKMGKNGIRNLLDIGTSVDIRGGKGQTALMVAAYNLHVDLVKFLLRKGANATAADSDGATALDYAQDPNVLATSGNWKKRRTEIREKIMRAQHNQKQ